MSLVFACLVPVFLLFVITGIGQALQSARPQHAGEAHGRWLERVCLGAALSVAALALLGLLVAFVPHGARSIVARIGLAGLLAVAGWGWARAARASLRAALPHERLFAIAYLAFCWLALALAFLPVRLPSVLVDGPYVVKRDLPGVRVQYSTGSLPTDNAIPHVVSEYLLRDISFRSERPLMPGQEVTNRPILAGLVTATFRAATRLPDRQQGALPRLTYVGVQWPDFSFLMQDIAGYRMSQAVGVALNALLLLAVGAFAGRAGVRSQAVSAGIVALYATSPYFLFQTYFTWPKALAGFFIIGAWLAVAHRRAPALAGALLALAYLSHPYAISFVGAYVAWLALLDWRAREPGAMLARTFAGTARFVGAFVLVTAPWWIFKSAMAIPSDLVTQNLLIPGQGPIDFVWARIVNVANTVLPGFALQYPFDLTRTVISASVNGFGALGVVVGSVLLLASNRLLPAHSGWILPWALPGLLLVGVFSNPAVPALHGWQPVLAVLLVVGVIQLVSLAGRRWAACLIGVQAAVNAVMLVTYYHGLL